MAEREPLKYNPAFLSDTEVTTSFVARYAELETLVEIVRDGGGDANQHVLVLGPRGAGKSMLLRRAVAEIRSDEELQKTWYPLVFSEESFEVGSPGELWLQALFHLGGQTGDLQWGRVYTELRAERDETRLRERALARLLDFADGQQRKLVLVVENLGTLFDEQLSDDDAWVLRHTLLNEPRLLLLGSATSRFEQMEAENKALFDLFRVLHLDPLTSQECAAVWQGVTGQELLPERWRPVQILTGGSPRLLTILATFGASRSFRKLMEDLTFLIDDHTEYFKSRLELLPAKERKVFLALAEIWDPAPARAVAEAARLPVNLTSSLLGRLESRGAVDSESERRTKYYRLTERLYNIYYLLRRQGAQAGRVRALVELMVAFFTPEEVSKTLVQEALADGPEGCPEHLAVYRGLLERFSGEELAERLLVQAPVDFLRALGGRTAVDGSSDPMESRTSELTREFTSSFEVAAEDQLNDWLGEGLARQEANDFDSAEAAFRTATENRPDSAVAWFLLGHFQQVCRGDTRQAEESFRKATRLKASQSAPWVALASLLWDEGDLDGALDTYDEALEVVTDQVGILQLATITLLRRGAAGDAQAAERMLARLLAVEPDNVWASKLRARILCEELGRPDDAEAAYRDGVSRNPDNIALRISLGRLLEKQGGRHVEAERVYQETVERRPDEGMLWALLGSLRHRRLGRPMEAERCYRKALELEPDLSVAWGGLGLLMAETRRAEEGLEALRMAVILDPQTDAWWRGWVQLAVDSGQEPSAFQTEVERLLEKSDRPAARLVAAQALLSRDGEQWLPCALRWAEEAVATSPEDLVARQVYALSLLRSGRVGQASEQAKAFFADEQTVAKYLTDAVGLVVEFAARGHAEEALAVVDGTAGASRLEPALVALRLLRGDEPRVATEIRELADDIVARIGERRELLKDERVD